MPLYEETNASDGYVSIEVSPYLAHETDKTITQAKVLWARVNRPNLMIKIPATPAGIPAIRKTIASGINVNVTLIFSLARYGEVMDAYLSGLEDRLAAGDPIDRIASVASFFISRVDSKVDARLPETSTLLGQAAIANARLYDQERMRAAHLELVGQIARQVNAVQDRAEIFDQVVSLTNSTFGFHPVSIFDIDPRTGEAVLQASSDQDVPPNSARIGPEQGIVGAAAANRETNPPYQ